ncbi:MAG TPA: response regulator [Nitrospirota bacterium]|nr:response regulator [Nitrospirota bacterium]
MDSTSSPREKRGHRSILVVGNKTQSMLSICLLLRRFAYNVSEAYTASQAFEVISANSLSLLITDLILPDMSGMEFFGILRQARRTASLPVVFVVPMSDAAAERRCYDNGAAGCITKPIQSEELYRVVQAVTEPIPRESIRIDTRSPISLNNEPLGCPDNSCAIELSEHGMYVPTYKPYPRNRRIAVRFHIKDRAISAEGSVVHNYTRVGQHREPGIGLKFVNIAPQDQEFIRSYIRDEIMQDVKKTLSPEF